MEDITMKNYKVLVIGDSCEDHYIYCKTERLCPDAPVPILKPGKKIISLGMAGNVKENLEAFELDVSLLTNKSLIQKIRYVDSSTNHMFVRVDIGDNHSESINPNVYKFIDWESYDAVVVSDYDKGFLSRVDLNYIATKHPLTFIDTKKPLASFNSDYYTFIKINNKEYLNSNPLSLKKEIHNKLIITLGKEGAQFKNQIFPVKNVGIKDTSGAGDTFLAGLVVEYLKTRDIYQSIEFANECATQVVQKKGTVKINPNEL